MLATSKEGGGEEERNERDGDEGGKGEGEGGGEDLCCVRQRMHRCLGLELGYL